MPLHFTWSACRRPTEYVRHRSDIMLALHLCMKWYGSTQVVSMFMECLIWVERNWHASSLVWSTIACRSLKGWVMKPCLQTKGHDIRSLSHTMLTCRRRSIMTVRALMCQPVQKFLVQQCWARQNYPYDVHVCRWHVVLQVSLESVSQHQTGFRSWFIARTRALLPLSL